MQPIAKSPIARAFNALELKEHRRVLQLNEHVVHSAAAPPPPPKAPDDGNDDDDGGKQQQVAILLK